jgi:hypothetical protein
MAVSVNQGLNCRQFFAKIWNSEGFSKTDLADYKIFTIVLETVVNFSPPECPAIPLQQKSTQHYYVNNTSSASAGALLTKKNCAALMG